MANKHIDDALTELAATAQYLQESGRLMREAVNHLVESEERIVKVNRYMSLVVERVEHAITAALKAADHGGE